MNSIQEKYRGILVSCLEAQKTDAEELACDLSGPTYVPNEEGQLEVGWIAEVALDGEFFASVPITGVNPPTDAFAVAADHLLKTVIDMRVESSITRPMSFTFTCVGQRGDADGNPVDADGNRI